MPPNEFPSEVDEIDVDWEDDEEAPLLNEYNARPGHIGITDGARAEKALPFYQTRSRLVITGIMFGVVFVLSFGGGLMAVPSVRLYEDIVCHHYYNRLQGDEHIGFGEKIDEQMCKVKEVQKELNILYAGLHFLGALPLMVTAVPYGLLGDRIGRKPVFFMAMLGVILANCWSLLLLRFWQTLHYRLLWLTPIFTLIGGGEVVSGMMFYAIGSDITPQVKRANIFLMGSSCSLLAAMIAPSVASLLMAKSPWYPLVIGLTLLFVGPALAISVPETLHMHPRDNESPTITPEAASERSICIHEADNSDVFATVISKAVNSLKEAYGSLSVLYSLPVILLITVMAVEPFTLQSIDLSIRYVSNRFHWKLRQTGFLLSLRAFINFVLLFALLPGFSHYLVTHRKFSGTEKDLFLARISVVVLVIGALLIAISPMISLTISGLIIFTLGTGTVALTRSLVTSLVDQEHVGRLYAAIGLVETISSLAAGPTLAALYTFGLQLGGLWVGLPFVALAGICFVGAVGIWSFGCVMRRRPRDRVPSGEEGNLPLIPDSIEGEAINIA